jgi:predicted nucleic acid-binding protein
LSAPFFLDTNVLVYPHDRREPERGDAAIAVLDSLAACGDAAVSTQVLGEFFWVVTRRLPDPLTTAQGARNTTRHAKTWRVVEVTAATVREALRGAADHGLPYWDSLILAAARLAQIPIVLSEDFADGREIDGVVFRNPLKRGFVIGQ